MVTIAPTLIVWGMLFIGIGTWFYRSTNPPRFSPLWAFWLGWAMTIALLQVWHFFAPINDPVRYILVLIGCAGILLNHRLILRVIVPLSVQKWVWLFICLMGIIYLGNRALYSTTDYTAFGFDTGFYHLPVMTWFNLHPIVIGLGNVHTRFGFSNAHFLYGAIFDNQAPIMMNTLLYVVFLSGAIWSVMTIWRDNHLQAEHIFRVLCIPFVLMWLFWRSAEGLGIPSTSNDVPIFMLGILLTGRTLGHIERRDIRLADVYQITLLVCVGVAVKFSFIILGGGLVIVASWLYILKHRARFFALMIGICFIGGIIIIPMMARSVIMTGYPLYPLTIGGFDVDWRINKQTALYEAEHIQTFARVLGDTPMYDTLINHPDHDWLSFWLEKSGRDYPIFFYTPLILIIIGVVMVMIHRKVRMMHLIFLDVLFISILFWFISAPLWRLSGGITWLFGASLLTIGIIHLPYKSSVSRWITTIALVGMTVYMLYDGISHRGFDFRMVDGEQPAPIRWIEGGTTIFGLDVRVAQDWLCWDDTPPCVPKQHYSPLLRSRPDGGYQLPDHAILFDPSMYQISLHMDTLEAVALTDDTLLSVTLTPLNDDFQPFANDTSENIFIDYTNTITPAQLNNRNNFSTTQLMGVIQLSDLSHPAYQVTGMWNGRATRLADIWQIRPFRFGDAFKITDTVIRHDDNRLMVQLVGEALAVISTRYHVAIWLRGKSAVFQRDVSPIIPTHDWTVGGRYLITAYFDDLPTGKYDLSVVWYDVFSPDLTRLNGFDADDNPLGDDVILIHNLDL